MLEQPPSPAVRDLMDNIERLLVNDYEEMDAAEMAEGLVRMGVGLGVGALGAEGMERALRRAADRLAAIKGA